MKLFTAFVLSLFAFCFSVSEVRAQTDLKLWYKQPARNWNEALPVGNGRLGAMVFGKVDEELIQLNEETLWSGGPANDDANPMAKEVLPEIRAALLREDYEQAEKLTQRMQGLFTESYEPLGDLVIRQSFGGSSPSTEYYRDLDLTTAISTTRFKAGDVSYSREIFVSAPDQVIVIHFSSGKKQSIHFSLQPKSPLYNTVSAGSNDEVILKGKAPSHTDPSYMQTMEIPVVYNDPSKCKGMRFELRIKAVSGDGEVTTDSQGLHVRNASDVTVIVSAATSFNGYDKCPDKDGKDESLLASQFLNKAAGKNFASLKADHISDYKHYFDRVSLQLESPVTDSPTDERLKRYAEGASDNGLESLYFQFGRYLLISSSRPGGIPANLQGIWNNHVRPPWSSNFTTNINTEMNYWMVESCNLSELHEPLLKLIEQLAVTGKATAKNFYNASGWTLHHNTDIWAATNPVSGSPMWANWPMGAAWLSQHLWEHYQFTGDKVYLQKTAYPLMKGAALFCIDWLIENKDGFLVTAPATSPENVFITDKGYKGTVSIATTMDMSLIWDLFTNVIQAAGQLDTDPEFRQLLSQKKSKLYPLKVGKKGNLQEWFMDWEDADPEHRHISHLIGLFPGRQISPLTTPRFAAAAKRSLELRGDGGTGWSKGWKINVWARLHDGNHAHKLIREQLKLTGVEGTNYANGGGTYPNLLDAHPPFQIDGNFGGTSGMTEMLVQSHDGAIHIFPALPDEWSSGKVTGLRARGGFTLDITWKNKKIVEVKVHSALGNNCRLRLPSPVKFTKGLKKAAGKNPSPFYLPTETETTGEMSNSFFTYDLQTQAGETYILKGNN